MRRALIILSIVIVLVGIGVGVYFYFFANRATIVVTPGTGPLLPIAGDSGAFGGGSAPATTTPSNGSSGASARLVQVSKGPVVPGVAAVDVGATASTTAEVLISYIERQSGNVFRYSTRTGGVTRTSNRTIPGTLSASWLPDASTAFVQYLSGPDSATVNTYALPANGSSGFFLPQNLSALAVSSTSVATLAVGVNGAIASLLRVDGTKASNLFITPLSSLRVAFAGNNRYLAFTKPSATLPGAAFSVDKTGTFTRIAGPLNGLVALPSTRSPWVLISYVQNDSMQTRLINTATNETVALPIATIADKCAWAANDASIYCGVPSSPPTNYIYPDDWYQGAAHFSDRIWKIDVSGRFAQMVLDFTAETKGTLDAQSLTLDPAASILVFVNKNDGSLWSYRL